VQDEISEFGGNASLVTLFGYSSSGATLLTFLASPVIPEHLFHRVFTSSACPRLIPHFSKSMSMAVLKYVGVSVWGIFKVPDFLKLPDTFLKNIRHFSSLPGFFWSKIKSFEIYLPLCCSNIWQFKLTGRFFGTKIGILKLT
jgi:hypothetical protein